MTPSRRWRSPTTPPTGWRRACGPPPSAARRWPAGSRPARSRSTGSSRPIRACPRAGSNDPATAASWDRTGSASSSTPSRSGWARPSDSNPGPEPRGPQTPRSPHRGPRGSPHRGTPRFPTPRAPAPRSSAGRGLGPGPGTKGPGPGGGVPGAHAAGVGCTAVMNARRHGPPRPSRRTFGAAAALMLVGAAGACTDDDRLSVAFIAEAPATQVLAGEDPARTALTLSALIVESADGVVIATEDSLEALAAVSASSRLPLLLGSDQAVAEEIDRLGAHTLIAAEGTDVSGLGDGLDLIEIDPADADAADSIPEVTVDQQPGRSEEHTSELQSRGHIVCRLLLVTKISADEALSCSYRVSPKA